MTIKKLGREINDAFSEHLKEEFEKRFTLKLDTNFNLLAMAMVSARVDGKPFTKKQRDFVNAYEAGYFTALQRVRDSR